MITTLTLKSIPQPLWRSYLRLCATNFKVADSIPDGIIPSVRTIVLVSTQPLIEMSSRDIF